MQLSEILILSTGGQVIANKKYRHDAVLNPHEGFFSELHKKKDGCLLPHFKVDAVHFYHIKRHQIHLVATSCTDVSPILVIELLSRLYHLLKDFCGTVHEESLHTNFILVSELLDEFMDCGCPQLVSTEKLKPYIQSEPVPIKSPESMAPGLFGIEHRLAPSDAANKPVIRSRWDQEQRKNEIFLDVVERMNILVAANGTIMRCEVHGAIKMKSFLVGCPEVKLGLNEDLTVGRDDRNKGYGHVVNLDDVSFHESVKTDSFGENRMLVTRPPEGEFILMTYLLQGDLSHGLPFRVYSYVNQGDTTKDIELGVKLRCEVPGNCQAVNVTVNLPVPKSTVSFSRQLSGPGQTAEWVAAEKKIVWKIKKIAGHSEASAHFKLIGAKDGSSRSPVPEIGPVALDFEVSGFVCSNLQIRFLRVFDREHSYVPVRWVRYITTADSYICKLS